MKAAALIAGLLLAAGLFWLLGPAHVKDRLKGAVTFASVERQCFNFHKDRFHDPESAYMEDSYKWTKATAKLAGENLEYDAVVRVKVHARNLMGAYVGQWIECPLVKGKFDEIEALAHRMRHRKGASTAHER